MGLMIVANMGSLCRKHRNSDPIWCAQCSIGPVYTEGMTKHGKRRDRVLEKMLNTPPKPHKTNKKKGGTSHAQKGRRGS